MTAINPYELMVDQFIKKAIKNAPPTTEEMKQAYKTADYYMKYGLLPEGWTND